MPNEKPNHELRVLFFSQLKDIVGAAEIALPARQDESVADLLRRLYQLHPGLEKWDQQILVGAGVDFVGRDYRVRPNDEIAIMPPVQGG